ncbi:hypothetical protein AV903_19715 [Erwinia tracheiphila]|uniref:Uncharacterized protein n=1 Tax=Erwinia tracheiphila TaxID=65700 RepID=A0A345CWE7_9GAMM|nr:hypothetical protein AV903_19715 [Erwinia tracheiphila]
MNFDLFTVDVKTGFFRCLRHCQSGRGSIFQFGGPVGKLGVFGLIDMFNHRWRCNDFCIRKSLYNRLQPKIKIRIPGGDEDGFQFLPLALIISTSFSPSLILNCESTSMASVGPVISVDDTANIPFSCGL